MNKEDKGRCCAAFVERVKAQEAVVALELQRMSEIRTSMEEDIAELKMLE